MKRKIKGATLITLVIIAFLFLPLMAYCNELGFNTLAMRLLAVLFAVIFLGLVIHFTVDTDKESNQSEKDKFINDNLNR